MSLTKKFARPAVVLLIFTTTSVITGCQASKPDLAANEIKIASADDNAETEVFREIAVRKAEKQRLNKNDKPYDNTEIEIRMTNEFQLKKQDKDYRQQAKAMAEQYRQKAELVTQQGGDPKTLLDAADYFEKQAE